MSEEQWRRVEAVIPKQKAGPEAARGDRLFIDAVLFRAKTFLALTQVACAWLWLANG